MVHRESDFGGEWFTTAEKASAANGSPQKSLPW